MDSLIKTLPAGSVNCDKCPYWSSCDIAHFGAKFVTVFLGVWAFL